MIAVSKGYYFFVIIGRLCAYFIALARARGKTVFGHTLPEIARLDICFNLSKNEYSTHLEFLACNFIDQGLLPVKRNWMFPSLPGTVGHSTALNDVLYLPKPSM